MDSATAGSTPAAERIGSDFTELSRSIKEAGLLRRRPVYYAMTSLLTIGAFAAAWAAFGLVGDSWWSLLVAAALALVATQLSFVGHDAGHKQIFRGRRANDAVGLVNAGLVGLSYGWWIAKHNRHHANPNHEDDDPDLDIPVLAFSMRQGTTKRGFVRWTTKYQAFLFFPLLLLEGFSLHWAGIQATWRGEVRLVGVERAVLAAHIVVYLAAVFLVLSPLTGIVFILVHKGLWGLYMGCSFAPNHKGMPTVTEDEQFDFLRKQVLTSRDVGRSRWVDLALGGLNYQIEHHLFPSMPRPSLRRAQPIVESYCLARGISYSRCGLFVSYGRVLQHLHAVGAPLRAAPARLAPDPL